MDAEMARETERNEIADFIEFCASRSGYPAKETLENIAKTIRDLSPEERMAMK